MGLVHEDPDASPTLPASPLDVLCFTEMLGAHGSACQPLEYDAFTLRHVQLAGEILTQAFLQRLAQIVVVAGKPQVW